MPAFDASSMILAWDNYPLAQFPKLWDWMSLQLSGNKLRLPVPAFEEVEDKADDCADWLRTNGHSPIKLDAKTLAKANEFKELLLIKDDKYSAEGVGENDLLIIASARIHSLELVSDEARQLSLPRSMANYKIPAVCALKKVAVVHMNFVEFFKKSGKVFG